MLLFCYRPQNKEKIEVWNLQSIAWNLKPLTKEYFYYSSFCKAKLLDRYL